MSTVVEVRDLTKVYGSGESRTIALDGVSVSFENGDFVAVIGASGSGKSTFLHIVGLLDRPTSGKYLLEQRDVQAMTSDELADVRSKKLGFVFQAYNLLPRTNALENVQLPLAYAGIPQRQREDAARAALSMVGMESLGRHFPSQLSGGQQQRIAIARALVNNPRLILADEPTGALDTKSSHEIMALLSELNTAKKITILLVTHERDIAAYARRILTFRDGRIESDLTNASGTSAMPVEA